MFKDRRHGEQLRLFIFIRMASTEAVCLRSPKAPVLKKIACIEIFSINRKKKKPGG